MLYASWLRKLARSFVVTLLVAPGCHTAGQAPGSAHAAPDQKAQSASPLPLLPGVGSPIRVESNVAFVSLEGPLWMGDALLFSDVDASKVYRLDPLAPAAARYTPFEFPRQTNGIGRDAQGRLYFCERAAAQITRKNSDGSLEVVADRFEGKRFNATNDLALRQDGNVYFSDPKWGTTHAPELGFEGAFRISPDGQVSLVTRSMTRPNGVALSPRGDTLYVGDDTANELRRFDVAADGSVSGERVFIAKNDVPGGHFATPDGICVDVAGNLYVTNNHDSVHSIIAFAPDAKLLGEIPLPGNPSNCSFGGADGKTLYATVGTAIYSVRMPTAGLP
ncbi:MAG: SMP-30/gluconolactonase/LRE family protein [Myxococcales bacterium]